MNDAVISSEPFHRPPTQAAEGLPRFRWSLQDFDRLSELGFFGECEHIELIDGELVPMHSKGARHEWVRGELQNYLVRRLAPSYRLFNEPGWRPGGDYYLEPDMIICRAGPQPSAVPPSEVLLKVEVSDTSLAYDTGRKAAIYARLGVPEYWIIDVNRMTTRVHRGPTATGYSEIMTLPADQPIAATGIPGFSARLADLGIPPL